MTPWEKYCESLGTTPGQHQLMCGRCDDLVDQPSDDPVMIKESALHGFGVFCTSDVAPYTAIARALDRHLCRTRIVGRWINHSDEPNCMLAPSMSGTFLLCSMEQMIPRTDELTIDYRVVDRIRKMLAEAETTGRYWLTTKEITALYPPHRGTVYSE